MAPLLSITHITAVDQQARQKIIGSLANVASFAREKEPDVLRFAVTTPRVQGDDSSIYVIEEYANEAALNQHLGSKAIANHLSLFATTTLLAAPPKVLTYKTFTSYTRPSVLQHPDPYILIAVWDYQDNTRTGALEGWQTYNDGCKRDEDGTMVQVLAKDENDANRVGGVMAFDSEKYFWDVHVAGEHTQRNKGAYGEIRTKTDLKYYKLVGGFLGRVRRDAKL